MHSKDGTASAVGELAPVLATPIAALKSSDGTLQYLTVDGTGALVVSGSGGGGGATGTIGAAVPATASPTAFKDPSGNLQYGHVDAIGDLLVSAVLDSTFYDASSGPTTFTPGVGGPITIATPGDGIVVVRVVGTCTGQINFSEQYTIGGNYFDVSYQVIGTITNPVSNYSVGRGSVGGNLGTSYNVLARAQGINFRITNILSTGSVDVSVAFKKGSGPWSNHGVTIVGSQNGTAMDVDAQNNARVTLLGTSGLTQWGDQFASDGLLLPNGGEGAPSFGSVGLLFNGATLDRQRGDATNGAFVNQKTWLGSTAPTVGSKTSANSVPVVVASDQADIPVKFDTSAVSALTNWTSATALSTAVTVTTSGLQTVLFRFFHTGSFGLTGGITFEGTHDGTNWATIPAVTIQAGLVKPLFGELTVDFGPPSTTRFALLSVAGYTSIRLRLSTVLQAGLTFSFDSNTSTGLQTAAVSPILISDPSTGDGAKVRTGSSAVVSTDNALVMALRQLSGESIAVSGTVAVTGITATPTALAPGYSDGVAAAFSQDLSGRLRVGDDRLDTIAELLRQQIAVMRALLLQDSLAYGLGPLSPGDFYDLPIA